jgi:predicted HicB family RNase H-like nuclease
MEQKWKMMTVRVPPEVHRALKIRAAEEGRSMAETIERLIREYVTAEKDNR